MLRNSPDVLATTCEFACVLSHSDRARSSSKILISGAAMRALQEGRCPCRLLQGCSGLVTPYKRLLSSRPGQRGPLYYWEIEVHHCAGLGAPWGTECVDQTGKNIGASGRCNRVCGKMVVLTPSLITSTSGENEQLVCCPCSQGFYGTIVGHWGVNRH